MFREIFRFDLRQHMTSILFWFTVLLFGISAFTAQYTLSFGGTLGNADVNNPTFIIQFFSVYTMIGLFALTLCVAMPLLRDHEHGIAELFFSKPVSKRDYLLGRIAAGFCMSLVLFLVCMLAMYLGYLMPWVEAERVGPGRLAPYLFAFAVIVIPNVIFISGWLAFLASTTRSIFGVYVGVLATFGAWGVSSRLINLIGAQSFAVIMDPSGTTGISQVTRYWLVSDFNQRLPEVTGAFLANRLFFSGLGFLFLGLAVKFFQPIRSGTGKAWFRRSKPAVQVEANPSQGTRIRVTQGKGSWVVMRQFYHGTLFELGGIIQTATFRVLVLLGMLLYFLNLNANLSVNGQIAYPVTSWLLQMVERTMAPYLSILTIFFAGELVFKERTHKLHEVTAAFPTNNLLVLFSKCMGLLGGLMVFASAMGVMGFVFQLLHGYSSLELGLYLSSFALQLLPFLGMVLLATAIQILVQHKFVGYLICVLLLLVKLIGPGMGVEDNLLLLGGAPALGSSEINGYGSNLLAYLGFQAYWILFSLVLLLVIAGSWVRACSTSFKQRLGLAVQALKGRNGALVATTLLAFLGLGAWLFYNTHVLNDYLPRKARLDRQQAYELEYGATKGMPQPKLVAVDATVDISTAAGTLSHQLDYTVSNVHPQAISEVHLLVNTHFALEQPLAFGAIVNHDPRFGLYIIKLNQALEPGTEASWTLKLREKTEGFANDGDKSLVMPETTFLHSYVMWPSFGYNRKGIIQNPLERKKRGLPELEGLAEPDNVAGLSTAYNDSSSVDMSDDGDWIQFNTVISTDLDQRAMAPGDLLKTWSENGRNYFHYKMDQKMGVYACWLIGRWEVRKDQWRDTPIEVNYSAKHAYNIDRMLEATKASLEYCSNAYSPYTHKQLRIIEFPREYGYFAESFASTVPFSESLGFLADIRDPRNFDDVFYITAHEVAHQWWGHQIQPANVKGAAMVAESLAQYSALMVMEQTYGPEAMRQFLKRELDNYLRSRGTDRLGEQPLSRVADQSYLHYNKGSLVFYRLREELGEEVLNRALRSFVAAFAYREAPFSTAVDVVQFIRAEAQPEQQEMITELFEKICFYSSKVDEVTAKKRADGRYEVTLTVSTAKTFADKAGKQTAAALNDWIEVGLFAKDPYQAHPKPLVLERKHITSSPQTFTYLLEEKPDEAGFDPFNKLIDQISEDNRMPVAFP